MSKSMIGIIGGSGLGDSLIHHITKVRHEDIDYYEVKQLLDKIFSDWVNQVEESGINSDENITKEIH